MNKRGDIWWNVLIGLLIALFVFVIFVIYYASESSRLANIAEFIKGWSRA